MKTMIALLMLLTSGGLVAQEVWVLTTRYYNALENPANARLERVYLHKGFMKMVTGDLSTVMNIAKGEIIYINSSNLSYWQGTPQRFNREARAALEQMISEKLLDTPSNQQEQMRAMYDEMLNTWFSSDVESAPGARHFTVRRVRGGEIVSGFAAELYSVYEHGIELEKLWIAPALNIAKDFDFVSLSHFLNQLSGGAYSSSFENSMEYFNLITKGYPVRVQMVKADGMEYISEVVEAKRIPYSHNLFAIPSNHSPSTLSGVGVWDAFR